MNPRTTLGILILIAAVAGFVFWGSPEKMSVPDAPSVSEPPAPVSLPRDPAGASDDISSAEALSPELEELRQQLLAIFHMSLEGETLNERLAKVQARKDALNDLLATLGPAEVGLLIALLEQEPDWMNRRQLILALGEIGSDEAANALVDHYWYLALETDGGHELNYTIKALGFVQSPHSFTLLTDLIGNEQGALHRFRFVEQLGRHKDNKQAIPTFLDVAENDIYNKARSRAALALKWADDPRTAPKIESMLETEKDKYVRQALCGTLGDLGDTSSISRLESIARDDAEYQTRMSAIRALSRIGGDRVLELLAAFAEADENERVRVEAQRALARLESEN